jgi:hypothetical protein
MIAENEPTQSKRAFLSRIQKSHNSNKYAGELAEDLLWKSIGKNPSAHLGART